MIELNGGLPLYQWDIGRTVSFDGDAVQFANKGDSVALTITPEEGASEVRIPDRFLATGKPLVVYEVEIGEGDVITTRSAKVFPVRARPKPKDYTPTQAEEAFGVVKRLSEEAKEAANSASVYAQDSADFAHAASVHADDAEEAEKQTQAIADGVDKMLEGLRTGYNGVLHETAGDAVRNQMANIYSAFDSVPVGNILNPLDGEKGKFKEPTVGSLMEKSTLAYTNYCISSNPIPIPSGMTEIILRTSGIGTPGDKEGVVVYLLDKDKCYVRKLSEYYKNIPPAGKSLGAIGSECVFMNVASSGFKDGSGINFSNLCISAKALDSFEKFTDKQDMTVKSTALPDNISKLPKSVEELSTSVTGLKKTVDDLENTAGGQAGIAPTNNMKMLVFGDSNTETANMDADGGNYNPNYRYNWPLLVREMLQAGELRNFARHGATCRDTGYQWMRFDKESGEVVLKPEPTYYNEADSAEWPRSVWSWCYTWYATQEELEAAIKAANAPISNDANLEWRWAAKDGIVYRMNLSEQVDLALKVNAADGYIPDIIIISISGNDSVAIATRPNDSQDSYSDAMKIGSLNSFNYNVRAKMHSALRYAMWSLRNAYPNARCFIATPLQRTAFECPTYILEAIPAMAKRYNFIVVDTQAESGIIRETCYPPKWEDKNANNDPAGVDGVYDTYDGLHTTKIGAAKLANLHASVILRTFLGEQYKK